MSAPQISCVATSTSVAARTMALRVRQSSTQVAATLAAIHGMIVCRWRS
jgi:hypothetical protein